MPRKKIHALHWDLILKRIHEGFCVPFLGAGVNVGTPSYEGLPLGGEVALHLVRKMVGADAKAKWEDLAEVRTKVDFDEYKDLMRMGCQDLSRVALRFKSAVDPPDFERVLASILPDDKRNPSPLLHVLAGLPLKLIVTTNYDRLMERALDDRPFRAEDIQQPWRFAEKLRTAADPLSAYIYSQLTDETRGVIAAYEAEGSKSDALRDALAADLSAITRGPGIYDENRFAGIGLQPQIIALAQGHPTGAALVRFNRTLLEEAYPKEVGIRYKVVVQALEDLTGPEQLQLQDELARHNGLLLYKFHGSFQDPGSTPPRLVITEEDYIDFLAFVGGKGEGVQPLIRQQMVDSTLLFLGYGLEDWNFRTMFKALVETLPPNERHKSFAIQKDPSDFWVEYWVSKGVVIYNCDLYEFADELAERYRAYATQGNGSGLDA